MLNEQNMGFSHIFWWWRGVIGYNLSIRVTLSLGFLMGQGLQGLSCVGDFNGKLFLGDPINPGDRGPNFETICEDTNSNCHNCSTHYSYRGVYFQLNLIKNYPGMVIRQRMQILWVADSNFADFVNL